MSSGLIIKQADAGDIPTPDSGKLTVFAEGGALYTKNASGLIVPVGDNSSLIAGDNIEITEQSGNALQISAAPETLLIYSLDDFEGYLQLGADGVENFTIEREASFYLGVDVDPEGGLIIESGTYFMTAQFEHRNNTPPAGGNIEMDIQGYGSSAEMEYLAPSGAVSYQVPASTGNYAVQQSGVLLVTNEWGPEPGRDILYFTFYNGAGPATSMRIRIALTRIGRNVGEP